MTACIFYLRERRAQARACTRPWRLPRNKKHFAFRNADFPIRQKAFRVEAPVPV